MLDEIENRLTLVRELVDEVETMPDTSDRAKAEEVLEYAESQLSEAYMVLEDALGEAADIIRDAERMCAEAEELIYYSDEE